MCRCHWVKPNVGDRFGNIIPSLVKRNKDLVEEEECLSSSNLSCKSYYIRLSSCQQQAECRCFCQRMSPFQEMITSVPLLVFQTHSPFGRSIVTIRIHVTSEMHFLANLLEWYWQEDQHQLWPSDDIVELTYAWRLDCFDERKANLFGRDSHFNQGGKQSHCRSLSHGNPLGNPWCVAFKIARDNLGIISNACDVRGFLDMSHYLLQDASQSLFRLRFHVEKR